MRHYIINDRVHGDGKQNRIFTKQLGINEMFLHATKITFRNPVTLEEMQITAPFPLHWEQLGEKTSTNQ
jgi:tRNA pseudouridine65 synthase